MVDFFIVMLVSGGVILFMEEIRLTTWDVKTPVNSGMYKLPINWLRISEPSTVSEISPCDSEGGRNCETFQRNSFLCSQK